MAPINCVICSKVLGSTDNGNVTFYDVNVTVGSINIGPAGAIVKNARCSSHNNEVRREQEGAEQARKQAEKQRKAKEKLAAEAKAKKDEAARQQQEADRLEAQRMKEQEEVEERRRREQAKLHLQAGKKNVAVTGVTGAGKSTLHNSLGNKSEGEPGYSPVDASGECTMDPIGPGAVVYNSNIALFDLPGGSTRRQPTASYCQTNCLDLFDGIVLCYHTRFGELDSLIMEYAVKHKLPVTVVYTKVDVDVRNMVRERKAADENAAFLKLRADIAADLAKARQLIGVPSAFATPVFLVDTSALRPGTPTSDMKFDEASFIAALKKF